MSNTPVFERWKMITEIGKSVTSSSTNKEVWEATTEAMDVLDQLRATNSYQASPAELLWLRDEANWHTLGRPYYKVYPTMLWQLQHTSLNFYPEYLKSPYPVFTVLFPKGSMKAPGVLVRLYERGEKAGIDGSGCTHDFSTIFENYDADKVLVLTYWDGDQLLETGSNHLVVGLTKTQTVEESVMNLVTSKKRLEGLVESDIPVEDRIAIWRTAIGVMMLGTDRHGLLRPDIAKEELEKRFPGGRSKASQRVAKERREKFCEGVRGWRVGSEIDLLASRSKGSGAGEERGSIGASHVRSGHMRMQPHGPKHSLRKLIYVAPTLVRPDLPMATSHGYRIQ